jgi:N-acetylmuramoyl-L-alanine amidase
MCDMFRGCLRVALGLLLTTVAFAAVAVEVRELRVASSEERTRLVLDLSASVDYTLFALENPDRIVIDLKAATLGSAARVPDFRPGVLQRVRTGVQNGRDLRVVLDLERGVRPRSFIEPPGDGRGHRLVIDLPSAGARVVEAPARTVQTAVPTSDRDIVIAIDAGHGGRDPGAIGPAGTFEKTITLSVAREVARQVNAMRGYKAVLIRDSDVFIPLEQRYRLAREAQADLFVSIHADAAPRATAAGSSVYVLSTRGATNEAARWLADRENAADLVGGVKLDDKDNTLAAVLLDLAQSATMKASEDAANQVLNALKRVGKAHKPAVERANFVVLRSPDVPSMLVEAAFISNPGEERKLNDPAYRRRLSAAVADGVRDFFSLQPPPGTWVASNTTARAREHIVARGETLSAIAVRHGVPLSRLRSANAGRLRGDVVRVGDRLQIPGA